MPGVGKLLKQAQKMQKKIEEANQQLLNEVIEVSMAGGAVKVGVNGHGEPLSLAIDPEFLKEEKSVVEQTVLDAFKDAVKRSKDRNQELMQGATAGFGLGGQMGLLG
ncbi:MAG: YbaB/EbfC family nucleoid-associated protein [Opitutales bacterium]|nr:YbaB/EbfC family nucleoid-associated protein [Opitutales bacterium]